MSALKEFQERHGAAWSAITNSEAFLAALSLAGMEKIQALHLVTTADIQENGKLILADLIGHLKYESALIGLHEKKELVFGGELGPEQYPNPAEEARLEALAAGTFPGEEASQLFQEARASTSVPIPGGRRVTFQGPKINIPKKATPKRKKKK